MSEGKQDIQAVLTARFIAAIRDNFQPCPLLGEKWFKYNASGKPVDFEFLGIARLAKAVGEKPEKVAHMLVSKLDLKGLRADVTIRADYTIAVTIKREK